MRQLKGRLGVVRLLMLVAVVLVVVGVFLGREHIPAATSLPTIFLLSFLGSAAIVLPVPHLLAVCAGGSPALLDLPPVLVALVAACGDALGELTGYAAGVSGRGVLERHAVYGRLEGWVRRRGALVLFLMSSIPNPIFDVVGVAAGALRFPVAWFLAVVAAGKFLKNLGIAYACYFGLESLLQVLRRLAG